MTAIGKLLVLSSLVAALGLLTWSTNLYVARPGFFSEEPEGPVDKGNNPITFKQMKADIDRLGRSAALASEAWGTHLKVLEEREKFRADRRLAYAERLRWAHKGNPSDPIDPTNPKSPGKGFYEPVVDPTTKLYDLSKDAKGIPKGKAVTGIDGSPLPGLDGLGGSIAGDTKEIVELSNQIKLAHIEVNNLSKQVSAVETRLLKMNNIRDSVQAELFFLSTFEVNVFETRETVFRRERQLRDRLKRLGVTEP